MIFIIVGQVTLYFPYIMSSEQLMNDIRKGEEDLKAGKGIEVNLENIKY